MANKVLARGGLGGDREIAVSCLGLERAGPKRPAQPAELLTDSQQACVRADVLPVPAENLAAPHPVQQ
jgi:hypothetical protein